MFDPRAFLRCLLLPSLALVGACDKAGEGTGTGETGTANETGEDGGGFCGEETTTLITDLDTPPPTFDKSVNELLAEVTGEYTGTFTWFENEGFVEVTHAGTSSPVEIGIAYEGGDVRLIEVEEHGNLPGGQLGGFPCSNRLEIDAQLIFVTEDGVFAESLTTTLGMESATYEPEQGLALNHSIDLDAHAGSLALSDFTFVDSVLRRLELRATFSGDTAVGSLNTEVENTGLGFVGYGPVASFQAYLGDANSVCGTCEAGEYCQAGPDADLCTPLPDACVDAPSCDCLEANACPGFISCAPGEVFTVTCEG